MNIWLQVMQHQGSKHDNGFFFRGTDDMRCDKKKALFFVILFFASCTVFSGCAPRATEQHPPVDNSRVFNAGFDTVWTQLLAAVTSGEETLGFVDRSAGLLSFQKNIPVKQLDTYAFNDTGMLMSNASANVVIRVTAEEHNRTRIAMKTKVTATGKDVLDVFLSRQRQVVLDSKGWLEREYFERLSALLKTKAGSP